jgi:putative addiction module CopG family antidote
MGTISPELEQFVNQEVASGRFANRDEVIVHALLLLKNDRDEAVAGINAGLADVAAGRVQPLHAAFDDLRREFDIPTDA